MTASAKSDASTPATASENVTVQLTDGALVGFASLRSIEMTVGAVTSRLPTAKSLKAVKPVPVAVVAVLVEVVGVGPRARGVLAHDQLAGGRGAPCRHRGRRRRR